MALAVMRIRPRAGHCACLFWQHFSLFKLGDTFAELRPRFGVVLVAAFTRVCSGLLFANVYELMFHPLRRPDFQRGIEDAALTAPSRSSP